MNYSIPLSLSSFPVISSDLITNWYELIDPIFRIPGSGPLYHGLLTDPIPNEFLSQTSFTQSEIVELVESTYSFHCVVYADGGTIFREYDAGMNLDYSSNNFYECNSETYSSVIPSRIIINGARRLRSERNTNSATGFVKIINMPQIQTQSELDAFAANAETTSYNIYTLSLIVKNVYLLNGLKIHLDLRDKPNLHPLLTSFNDYMYITNTSYDVQDDDTYITISNLKRIILKDNANTRIYKELTNIGGDGLIYLPQIHLNNYNLSTSAWITDTCANNTITPLEFHQILSSEGHFVWNATNRTRVYVPSSGWYLFSSRIQYRGNNVGNRQGMIRINGVNADSYMIAQIGNSGATDDCIVNAVGAGRLDAGDYIELCANQNSGATLDVKYFDLKATRLSL